MHKHCVTRVEKNYNFYGHVCFVFAIVPLELEMHCCCSMSTKHNSVCCCATRAGKVPSLFSVLPSLFSVLPQLESTIYGEVCSLLLCHQDWKDTIILRANVAGKHYFMMIC